MRLSFVTGLSGLVLTDFERRFLRASEPAGLIIFSRNVRDGEQLRRLIGDARDCIGADDALVVVDQEGGRVQRLGPPEWPSYPAARGYGILFERDPDAGTEAAKLVSRLVAADLHSVGINTNCVPVADLPVEGAHDVIGRRAYGHSAEIVTPLARAVAEGQLGGGVLPVVKHVPGHGRASADSHHSLPIVETDREELAATDFRPFKSLSDMPAMMTAHVVFAKIDDSAPASTSRSVHEHVVRGAIGFEGLLLSDDLSMNALEGPLAARTRAVLSAGTDIALHCNGKREEMEQVAGSAHALDGRSAERFSAACLRMTNPDQFDRDAAEDALRRVREICSQAFG